MDNAATTSRKGTTQLRCGAVAGPLFACVFTAIGAARAGYDWKRFPVSSLAIGRHGWSQRVNFVVTGVLYVCAARGLRRHRDRRVGPRAVAALVTGIGVGLVGSGVFVTDPVGDFPPKTPGRADPDHEDAPARAPSVAGRLHALFAIPIFAGIPITALVSAGFAARRRQYGWATYSTASSIATVASFLLFGRAFGGGSRLAGMGGIFQRISIASGFGWLTALFLRAIASTTTSSGTLDHG